MSAPLHLEDGALQGLADGTLRGPQGFAAHAHCDACVECAASLAAYSALATQLSALHDPAVPPDFTTAVLAAVDARELELAQRRHTWFAALPAAALALFAIVGWMLSAAPATHVDRLVEGVTVVRHLFGALAPVFDAARLPLGLSAFALTVAILFVLLRTLRTGRDAAPVQS